MNSSEAPLTVLLKENCYSVEDIIVNRRLPNLWERVRKLHGIHPERGDRLIFPCFERALFTAPERPPWVIESCIIGYLHYFVQRGDRHGIRP